MGAHHHADAAVVEALRRKLGDPSTTLPQKYRVLFSLRNLQGQEAHAAMLQGRWRGSVCHMHAARTARGCGLGGGARAPGGLGGWLGCTGPGAPGPPAHRPPPPPPRRLNTPALAGLQDASALFRHEVAYCLGQRQDPAAVQTLVRILKDEGEHPM